MLTETITIENRDYHSAPRAAQLTRLSERTLRYHAGKELPHIKLGRHSWYNLDDICAYFAGFRQKQERAMRYKRDTVEMDGRVYHTMAWYEARYGVTRYQLEKLPHRTLGKRVRLIAAEDFAEVYWYKEERQCL